MILSEWIKNNKGQTAKIGTKQGSGFIFAGTVDAFTLNHIEAYTGLKMHERTVLETYSSVYGGHIVIIRGKENGLKDIPTNVRYMETVQIQNYQSLIDAVAKCAAQDYEQALTKKMFSTSKKAQEYSEYDINQCKQFFLSDSFALMMPNVNGEDVLRLIEKKVYKAWKRYGKEHDNEGK